VINMKANARNKMGGKNLRTIYPIFALIILIIVFSSINMRFLSLENFYTILKVCSVLLIVAIGQTIVLLMGSIDFSVGGVMSATIIIVARLLDDYSFSPLQAILFCLFIGCLFGFLNGVIFTKLKIPSFLTTLAVGAIGSGISLILCGGYPITVNNPEFLYLAQGKIFGFPLIFLIALGFWLLVWFLISFTQFGRHVYATGGMEKAAIISGVKVNRIKCLAFVISGLCAGFAGVLLCSRLATGWPRGGEPYILDSIAAVCVGGTSLTGGSGGLVRTFVGALLMTVLTNGMGVVGISPFIQQVVSGLLILITVTFTIDRSVLEVIK